MREPMIQTVMTVGDDETTIDVAVTRLVAEREVVRAAEALLSADERNRANRFVFDRDRTRFVISRARLRQLLAERLGARPESVELMYGARGKPAIARRSGDPDLRFNVSHCDDLAVYALSIGGEVGVDVEAVRPMRDADAIAERFFSPAENASYRALDPRDRPLGFFNCWTRKEAFIKALGDGLACPLDCFDVSLAPGEPARILRVEHAAGDERCWDVEGLFPAPGFVAAVVAERR